MLKIILELMVYLFAVFGTICFLNMGSNALWSIRNQQKLETRMVLLVKNQQEHIEGIIRSLYKDDTFTKILCGKSFDVIDLGSKDDTVVILNKLKKAFQGIEVIPLSDREVDSSLLLHKLNTPS